MQLHLQTLPDKWLGIIWGIVSSGKRSTQVEGHANDDTNVNGDDNVGVYDDDGDDDDDDDDDDDADGGAIASTDGRHPGDLE